MKWIFTFMLVLLCSTSMAAEVKPVLGKHGEMGLTCAACHETDKPTRRAPASTCQKCHGGYAQLKAKTAGIKPNPHDSHQGELRCTLCHTAHKPPVLYCNQCHNFDIKPK